MTTPSKRDIASAKARRSALRSSITREVNASSLLLQKDLEDVTREEVRGFMAKLQRYYEEITPFDEVMRNAVDADGLEAEETKIAEYDLKLGDTLDALKCRLQELTVEENVSSTSLANQQPVATATTKHRMPELLLTKFNGDPLHWEEFWDDFRCSVDERTDISVIDKFKLLKQSLQGEAADMAEGYYLTVANYEQLKEALAERFGDTQVAISAHLEALLEMKPATVELSTLIKTRDKCEAHIRSLIALGLKEEAFGQVYAPIILSKLPKLVKMDMNRRNGAKAWTLAALREALKDEIQVRAKSEKASKAQADTKGFSAHAASTSKKSVATTSALLTVSGKKGKQQFTHQKRTSYRYCVFCEGNHPPWECKKYPDTQSRLSRLGSRCGICLREGHYKADCRSPGECRFCHKRNHHGSLCFEKFGSPEPYQRYSGNQHRRQDVFSERRSSPPSPQGQMPNNGTSQLVQMTNSLNPKASTFQPANVTTVHGPAVSNVGQKKRKPGTAVLASARILVSGSRGKVMARAVFDDGSTLSFIRTKLARSIGATPTGYEVRAMGRFGDSSRQDTRYSTFEFAVEQRDGSQMTLEANAVEHVSTPLTLAKIDMDECLQYCKEEDLAEVLVDKPTEVEIDILIGLDYYHKFIGDKQWRCSNGLVLKDSSVGFIVTGYAESPASIPDKRSEHGLLIMNSKPKDHWDFEKFWRLEEVGITDKPSQNDDEAALEKFNATVIVNDDRFEVEWPFKEQSPDLPVNYEVALRRLCSVYKKLSGEEELLQAYDKVFEEQRKLNIIETAPEIPEGVVHYLPHHAVITPQKTTTKLRVVFDASSKPSKHCQSLNEAMYRGPVFLNDLCGLLLRFRMHAIVIVSDVEKAFLQIGLQQHHRDCTRFLWLQDIKKPPTVDNLVVLRYTRVLFGATASPFLLAACITHHMKSVGTPTSLDITENTYVDNVLAFRDSTDEAAVYYREAKHLFGSISMNLREWYSNDQEFLNEVDHSDRGKSNITTVLGIKWDTVTDTLRCAVGHLETNILTKRNVLRSIATVYDPCGWFSPVTIRGKLIMQLLWEQKLAWDDLLSADIAKWWIDLASDLQQIKDFVFHRWMLGRKLDKGQLQLHGFCDASKSAYAAMVFLRVEDVDGVKCGLLFAKARVAPLKKLTVPRLELVAALIGARLMEFVSSELKLKTNEKYLWSDSKCVLDWLRSEKVSTVFVSNRVRQIKKVKGLIFRHVPTESNPADLATRGISMSDLRNAELWWNGPEWLQRHETCWPVLPSVPTHPSNQSLDEVGVGVDNVSLYHHVQPDVMFDIKAYSSIYKLHRVTSYLFRAMQKLQRLPVVEGRLTVPELRVAEEFWVKRVQKQHFGPLFMKNCPTQWKNLQRQLGIFIDANGCLRCRGRFGNAEGLTLNAMNPKLLPQRCHYTDLVIQASHRMVLHFGSKHTLADVRRNYWIPHGRVEVKRVLAACLRCTRWTGGPFRVPDPPALPDFRSSLRRPFSCIGLDYLGPLFALRSETDKPQKVWIGIFTCAVVRAVHLEVVSSLSAKHFLLGFRRFMATYGKPDVVVSDNAKHFKLADQVATKAWCEILEGDEVQEFSVGQKIQWKFITEMAPWMGGFYERLVAPVKSALKKALGKRSVTIEELQTLVLEISAVLNGRPLVYSEDDAGDEALTPAHLMFRCSDIFPGIPDIDEYRRRVTQRDALLQHWKTGQKVLKVFWDAWQTQYLLSLREQANQLKQRGASDATPVEGAVVLLKEKTPRGSWKMGKIVKLLVSEDQQVRSVEVLLPRGGVVKRPIKLLCPLECSVSANAVSNDRPTPLPDVQQNSIAANTSIDTGSSSPAVPHMVDVHTSSPRRPLRSAAAAARERTRQML